MISSVFADSPPKAPRVAMERIYWQAAYSELFFSECLWPEFGEAELDAALAEYARRDRRFGAVQSRAEASLRVEN